MQTQRGIVGRGKMDVEGDIEHEGHWTFYGKCTGWMTFASEEKGKEKKRKKYGWMNIRKVERVGS